MSFFQLPVEIRLNVYSQLFGNGVVYAVCRRQDVGIESETPSMFSNAVDHSRSQERSAQLLRTCKTILAEARPTLYKNTTFRSSFEAFAGQLPTRVANESTTFPYIMNLEWSLHCDLLKRHNLEEVSLTDDDVRNLQYLQITCQVESWKGSYCGEWTDRKAFVNGRQQVVDFAKLLQLRMSRSRRRVTLVEDIKYLSRGRVVLRLFVGRRNLGPDVSSQGKPHYQNVERR